MLDKLYGLPRFLLVFILLSAGILFIVINDPPHSLCDTQIDTFKKTRSVLGKVKGLTEECKNANGPGGCYELFGVLRRVLRNFRLVSEKCQSQLANLKTIKKMLFEQVELMTHLAWREEILQNKVSRLYWLSATDISLFCKMKNKIILFYGRDSYLNFTNKIVRTLPGADKYNPEYVRKRTIISESCSRYL